MAISGTRNVPEWPITYHDSAGIPSTRSIIANRAQCGVTNAITTTPNLQYSSIKVKGQDLCYSTISTLHSLGTKKFPDTAQEYFNQALC